MQHFLSYPTNLVAVCGAGMIGRRNSLKDSDPDLTTCSACRATKAWEDAAETVTANARQDAADWAAARAATGKARIVKTGSSDYGYVSAVCHAPECADINGRPWAQMYSRRTVEGYDLAERDADAHNRARHTTPATTTTTKGPATMAAIITGITAETVALIRDSDGRVEYVDVRIETPLRLTTATIEGLARSAAATAAGAPFDWLEHLAADVDALAGVDGGANLYFCTLTTEPKE